MPQSGMSKSKKPNVVQVNVVTDKGGAVNLNQEHHVWASYAVAGVGGMELLYAGAKLPDGRSVQFFLNRETGLVVVDVINKGGESGTELLRKTIDPK